MGAQVFVGATVYTKGESNENLKIFHIYIYIYICKYLRFSFDSNENLKI